MSWSWEKRWLGVSFAIAVAALLGTGLGKGQQAAQLEEMAQRSQISRAVLEPLAALQQVLAKAAIRQQDYLQAGDEEAIAAYFEEVEVAGELLEEIADWEAEYRIYSEDLATLKLRAEERLDILNLGLELARRQVSTPKLQLELFLEQQKLQQEMEAIAGDILAAEWEEQQVWFDEQSEGRGEFWVWLDWGSRWLCVAWMGSAFWVLQREWLMREGSESALSETKRDLLSTIRRQAAEISELNLARDSERDRRATIETRYEAMVQEREIDDVKLRFFSLASHELRTPLSTILVSAQLLSGAGEKWSEEKKQRNLDRIQASAKAMTQLLADMLTLTRAEAGKLEFSPQLLPLIEQCQASLEEVRFTHATQHDLQFQYRASCPQAYLDEKLWRSVFINLVTNAIKYSPEGSEVCIFLENNPGQTRLEVRDRGIGIPTEDRRSLFESFHRGQNVDHIPGTGLGLAVVKKSVEMHGGTISVESELGVGSTFRVEIPWDEQHLDPDSL